jgi:hypothetical protein
VLCNLKYYYAGGRKMRYDIVGAILLYISAFLYASRYITAAILQSGRPGGFNSCYDYVGDGLTTWSMLALFAGLGIILWGSVMQLRKKKTKHNKPDVGDT